MTRFPTTVTLARAPQTLLRAQCVHHEAAPPGLRGAQGVVGWVVWRPTGDPTPLDCVARTSQGCDIERHTLVTTLRPLPPSPVRSKQPGWAPCTECCCTEFGHRLPEGRTSRTISVAALSVPARAAL